MDRSLSIRIVSKNLGRLYIGPVNKRKLNITEFAITIGLLSRVSSHYRYTGAEKVRTLKILGNIALTEIVRRRGSIGARQSKTISRSLVQLIRALPATDSSRPMGEEETMAIAKAVALGVYSLSADELAFQRNRETDLPYNSRVTSKLRSAEKKYLKLLKETHTSAKSGNRILLRKTLNAIVTYSQTRIFFIAQRIGLSSSNKVTDERILRAEVRVATLLRKTATLAAACIFLEARLSDPDLNRTTKGIAKRRSTLTRGLTKVNTALSSSQSLVDKQVVQILTRIENIKYIKRGRKPLSTADCVPMSYGIQVPYKALWQSGVSAGPIWFQGRYKAADNVIELEFEGIERHASSVWEDWMASQARDAFNINIGNLHAESGIPLLRTKASGLDISKRIGGF